jgi:hypothetical protein
VLNKKPQNNLQLTKNCASDTTKAIVHSSQNVNSVISAANVGDNTRKFAALDHNRTRDYIYQLGKYLINLTSLSKFLSFYPNKSDSIELLKVFQQGFSLNHQGPRLPTDANNLPSARKYPDILQGKIDKDVEAGRIAGPFVSRPSFANIEEIPLGLVSRKDRDFRVIHHLAYPVLSSVNDFIDESSTKCNDPVFRKRGQIMDK